MQVDLLQHLLLANTVSPNLVKGKGHLFQGNRGIKAKF